MREGRTVFNKRDLDLVLYIASKERASLKELAQHFSEEWGVSPQAVYKRIDKLVENGVLTKKNLGRNIIMVEFSTKFLLLMEKIVKLLYSSDSWYYDRVRKARKRIED